MSENQATAVVFDSDNLTLLSLTHYALSFTGRIEEMSSDERVLLLGAFSGAVLRVQGELRALLALYEREGDAGGALALGHALAFLGDADWTRGKAADELAAYTEELGLYDEDPGQGGELNGARYRLAGEEPA
jgi:hypothetical protein